MGRPEQPEPGRITRTRRATCRERKRITSGAVEEHVSRAPGALHGRAKRGSCTRPPERQESVRVTRTAAPPGGHRVFSRETQVRRSTPGPITPRPREAKPGPPREKRAAAAVDRHHGAVPSPRRTVRSGRRSISPERTSLWMMKSANPRPGAPQNHDVRIRARRSPDGQRPGVGPQHDLKFATFDPAGGTAGQSLHLLVDRQEQRGPTLARRTRDIRRSSNAAAQRCRPRNPWPSSNDPARPCRPTEGWIVFVRPYSDAVVDYYDRMNWTSPTGQTRTHLPVEHLSPQPRWAGLSLSPDGTKYLVTDNDRASQCPAVSRGFTKQAAWSSDRSRDQTAKRGMVVWRRAGAGRRSPTARKAAACVVADRLHESALQPSTPCSKVDARPNSGWLAVGPAGQITNEVFDMPSWQGPTRNLLYMSIGSSFKRSKGPTERAPSSTCLSA